jgi:ribosomal protein S18 acetylase RimI-like enzyme
VYSASDAEEMTELVADAFSSREPLALAVGLTRAEFAAFVRTLLPSVEAQGLTMVARRADTGEMVGAMLAEDAGCEDGGGLEMLGVKFAMVGSILGKLVSTYRAGRKPARCEMLHLYLLAVSDRAAGMGIGERLVAACIENGGRRGYRLAVAECTGKASQHIFRKLGFAERGMVSYADHLFEGRRVFESVAEHGGAILMEKVLATAD